MDKLLETIDEIKTLIPDAKYMTLMESLSVLNKQVPTEYQKLLLNASQFLIQKSRLNKFEYFLQDRAGMFFLTARFRMPSCEPLGVDYLDKIICRDPREQHRSNMHPNFILSCEAFAACGDGPHHYTVTYSSVQTTTITTRIRDPQKIETYFDLIFVLSTDKHSRECSCSDEDCLANMSDINKMGNNVISKFICKLIDFSTSSQTVWPYREDLEIDDDDDD